MLHAADVFKLYQTHTIDDQLNIFEEQLEKDFEANIHVFNQFIEKELKKSSRVLEADTHGKYLTITRCAAHVLMLVCKDTFASNEPEIIVYFNAIERAREMIKKLRTENIYSLISLQNLPKPDLDCPTRWNSVFEMLLSLLKLKDFCNELSLVNEAFVVEVGFWLKIETIVKVLEIFSFATKKIQRNEMVLSDVYGIILVLKHRLEMVSTNVLAKEFIKNLNKREPMVIQNICMCACLFLDPRYHCIIWFYCMKRFVV